MTTEEELDSLALGARRQLRMAVRMAREFGDDIRYVDSIGWLFWSKSHWVEDKTNKIQQAVLVTRVTAMNELAHLSGDARDELYSDAKLLDVSNNIQGVIHIARALPPFATSIDDLDSDPYEVNTPDGTYDLRTGTMRSHSRGKMHTKVTGAGIDGATANGMFATFIRQILPDEEVRRFAQKVFGSALYGRVVEQIFPIPYGIGGTGKSTLLDVLLAAFGTYADLAPNTLLLSTNVAEQRQTEIADLRGMRLVVVHETEQGQRLKTASMKSMTGRDKLKGRRLYKSAFTFTPSHTFALVTNYPPQLDADDDAAWDRIKVIPFTQKFRGTSHDNKKLNEQIIENDLPSVMRWLIDGFHLYEEEGLTPPEAVVAATREHNDRVDTFSQFLADAAESAENALTTVGDVTKAWTAWCRVQNMPPGKANDMADKLRKRGFDIVKIDRRTCVRGLRLVDAVPTWLP